MVFSNHSIEKQKSLKLNKMRNTADWIYKWWYNVKIYGTLASGIKSVPFCIQLHMYDKNIFIPILFDTSLTMICHAFSSMRFVFDTESKFAFVALHCPQCKTISGYIHINSSSFIDDTARHILTTIKFGMHYSLGCCYPSNHILHQRRQFCFVIVVWVLTTVC